MIKTCKFCLKDRQANLFYETSRGQMCHHCNTSFVKGKTFNPERKVWIGKRKKYKGISRWKRQQIYQQNLLQNRATARQRYYRKLSTLQVT